MTHLAIAWETELRKLRHSVVAAIITPLLAVFLPVFAVGAVALARAPQLPGLAGAKFAPYASGDLASAHFFALGQLLSVAVLGAGGFGAAWLFGREFSDGTAGALFGLAVPRTTIAAAKSLVLATWITACAVTSVAVTLALSVAVGARPGEEAWGRAVTALLVGLLGVAAMLPFCWVATLTRSQLGTAAVLVAVVMVTEIVVVLGGGSWFPFAVPSLLAGMGGPEAAQLGWAPVLLTAAVAPVAVLAVVWQWRRLTDT